MKIKKLHLLAILCISTLGLFGQGSAAKNSVKLNAKTALTIAEAVLEYRDLIGVCDCKSLRRDAQGKWQDTTELKWKWNYIMNKKAVKDEGWFMQEGKKQYFTSIRVYDTINQQWYVSYFTPSLNSAPQTWTGGKKGQKIVLSKKQNTPQGPMNSELIFSEISAKGFYWEGKLTNLEKQIDFPFWKIWCIKNESYEK